LKRTLDALPRREEPNQIGVALKKDGGTFVVPVEVNGAITLDFTIDSGATDVTVPADVFSTLTRTGTINDEDITGEQTYVLADGSKTKAVTFTIRSLRVGDKVIENVRGSVAPAQGSLLLGQSFLEHFKSWAFDNTKHQLVLEPQ
jgi:clan AA aspartic protease (TIGR02281 family)